jgi:hypothetical protein
MIPHLNNQDQLPSAAIGTAMRGPSMGRMAVVPEGQARIMLSLWDKTRRGFD